MRLMIDTIRETPVLAVADEVVDDASTAIDCAVTRCTAATPTDWTDPACFIEVLSFCSLDDGHSWQCIGGWGAYGGVHVRRDGTEGAHSTRPLPVPPGVNRLVKSQITVSRSVDLEVSMMELKRRRDGRTDLRQLG